MFYVMFGNDFDVPLFVNLVLEFLELSTLIIGFSLSFTNILGCDIKVM